MLWGAHDPFRLLFFAYSSSRNLSHRGILTKGYTRLRGGEHERKSSPVAGIPGKFPEGEIDAIAIVIERDIISIIIIIISTIYTAITTAAPLADACKGYNHNQSNRVEHFFKNFIDTSSEEESDDDFFTDAALLIHEHIVSQIPVYRGSLPGRAAALDRKRERGHDQLYNDYFQPKPLFTPTMFRRRFRMSRPLFRRIMDGVKIYDDYFCAKVDAIGKVGLSSYQKCTAAIRMLAYGVAGDFVDEYTRMSESTGLEAMYRFCRAVIGAYSGHSEGCTVILEVVASHDTWIWHSFFGMAGSHNDINVLQRSPVFDRLAYGQSPDVDFEINGHHYTKGYYLADGIYPPWATLVKTIRKPNSEQEARFAKEQEAARKDVERAFGILQARWAIVRHPARAWDVQTLWEVMTACVIMHNMIVEVERDDSLFDNDWEGQESWLLLKVVRHHSRTFFMRTKAA
ncbi:hypothetical protein QYE76_045419 [Lolium multiflorum]|uniref:Uncharacterized protein n=1 Tax=Lolium multiflorum TaxID=4521 RepID=A0AAD8WZS1_LOLMU|nr:hypothetical protein QYE76_045419 [Lolium multiflorum]